MNSPCTLKINKLRRKNRALLDQLETNSALLERRLKKLKHTAKTEKHSDKSWEDLPPSPLKRKFEYWKARNYSGQVSAALQRDLCDCKRNSSDIVDAELQLKENMEKGPVTSPAKRTRHSVLIVSNPRRKSPSKPRRKLHSPRKTSVTTTVTKTPVKCSTCHSRKLTYENETSMNEAESSSSSATCVCNCNKVRSPKRYSVEKEKKICMDKRTLEAVKSMLNYSPQSVFLRQIKKRSQTLENLLSPGNIRKSPKVFPTYAKSMETVSDRITETKKAKVSPIKYTYFDKTSVGGEVAAGSNREFSSRPTIAKLPIKDLPNKTRGKLPSADIYNRPMRAKSAPRDFYSKSPPRDVPSKIITAKLPLNKEKINENSPMIETKNTRKTRKRVCYRKNCYCRVQHRKPKPKKKTVEDVKENLTKEDSLIKNVSSSEDLTSPHGCHCCCHCDHRRKSPPPKTQLLTTNTISSLVDNEVENKYIHGQCCDCDKESGWFNKINEFRQSHYFDCHAHPSSLSLDSARNWETMSGQPLGHKCVHKYTVDDRLFAKPLYSDHQNNSRCSICHLPLGTAKTGRDELLPITLPSKLDEPIIQVSVPLQKNKHMSLRTSNSSYKKFSHTVSRGKTNSPKIKSRLTSSTVGDFKAWMPPPADSLALRYQKGVIK